MNRLLTAAAGLALLCISGLVSAAGPLVDAQWLIANMQRPDVVVLDLQTLQGYRRAHIPGAIHAEYADWRTGKKGAVPKVLPPVEALESLIGGYGIDNDTQVVLVPFGRSAGDLATATRIYWTFKVLGHDKVSILDGGLIGYARGGRNRMLQKQMSIPTRKVFKAAPRKDYLVTREEMKQALDAGVTLVDSRSRAEYLGIYGAGADERPGTIPGAVNLPYDWLTVNGGGQLQGPEAVKTLYRSAGVPLDGEQISFCHTGHRTSLAWFVSHELLGNQQARMYDGSMAEWARVKELPMELKVDIACKAMDPRVCHTWPQPAAGS